MPRAASSPHSFDSFIDTQIRDLRERFGMAMWCLARKHGDQWLVLRTIGKGYRLSAGDHFAWKDMICSCATGRSAPAICPDTGLWKACQSAPITRRLNIKAYLSLPLKEQNGRPFGTLCAFDPAPQPQLRESSVHDALQRQRQLLEAALAWNLASLDEQRIREFIEEEGRDPETGLLDGAGWSRTVEREQQRCQSYGQTVHILRLSGDTLDSTRREQLADSLAALIHKRDSAAHLGDGRFTVLLANSDLHHALDIRNRILDALNAKGMLMRCSIEPLATTPRTPPYRME